MDPVTNPYNAGAGEPPPALVGRDQELSAFDIAVRRLTIGRSANSQLLYGLRGVGKTVLLKEFTKTAEDNGWISSYVEISAKASSSVFAEVIYTSIRKSLESLSAKHAIRNRIKRAAKALRTFSIRYGVSPAGDQQISLEMDPALGLSEGIGILEVDLSDLFIEVGEAAREAGAGVLLAIDEMHNLPSEDLTALIMALHRVCQEQLPLMAAGAGLPSLPGLAGDAVSYAERLFKYTPINSLQKEDARLALTRPADEQNIAWEPDALDEVFRLTKGYPYFLQMFGKHAWNISNGPDRIGLTDVEQAAPEALAELDNGFFKARLDRVNDSGREFLRAMSSLGPGPEYKSGEVTDRLGKTPQAAGATRKELIDRGLIYDPRWGVLAFTVPMLHEYIQRTLGAPEGPPSTAPPTSMLIE